MENGLKHMDLAAHTFSDRMFVATLALMASALLGGPGWLYHFLLLDRPGRSIAGMLDFLGRKLNRTHRSAATRRMRGVVVALVALILAIAAGLGISSLRALGPWYGLPEIILLALLLQLRPPLEHAGQVVRALRDGKEQEAASVYGVSMRRDSEATDKHGVIRSMIEHLALHFSDRLTGLVFWYILLGLPGAFCAAVLSSLAAYAARRGEAFRPFGMAATRLDALAQLIPSRLGGLLLVLAAAFVPAGKPLHAMKALAASSGGFIPAKDGPPLAAAAGALGVTLGGPRRLGGLGIREPWLEYGSLKPSLADLRRARWLYGASCGLLILIVAAMSAWL